MASCEMDDPEYKNNRELQVVGPKDLTIDVYRPLCNKDTENEGKRIKSFAFDLHSTVSIPPKLSLLQSNTDLNTPPPNWLLSRPRKIVGPVSKNPKSAAFASFHMASSFLDCMGEVDVVSDAENIKKLLKIPYSKGAVSMMVHRVGNTLLLDEFDIHTHLLRAAENEWGWLKKFYLEHIFASCHAKQKASDKKSSRHSRDYLQQQNLISKFLYHSIAQNESDTTETQACNSNHQVQVSLEFGSCHAHIALRMFFSYFYSRWMILWEMFLSNKKITSATLYPNFPKISFGHLKICEC